MMNLDIPKLEKWYLSRTECYRLLQEKEYFRLFLLMRFISILIWNILYCCTNCTVWVYTWL